MATKVSKEKANYREGSDGRRCSQCTHFRHGMPGEKASCTVVAGDIGGDMVSDYFKRR